MVLLGIVVFQRGTSPPPRLMGFLKVFSLLVGYIVIVNSVQTIINFDFGILLYAAFYLFNLFLIYVVLSLYKTQGDKFLWTSIVGLLASGLLQIIYIKLVGSEEARTSAGFDNPNQLGYYSVLVASSIFVLSPKLKVHLAIYLMAIFVTSFLAVQSISKAAMVSLLLVFLIGFWKKPIIVILLIVGAVIIVYIKQVDIFEESTQLSKAKTRIERIGEDSDDNMAARGYDRLLEHPKYLIFGAGEGATYRFHSKHHGEMHSTLGTLFFSYGAVGLSIFLFLCYTMYKNLPIYSFMFLIPSLLYGVTHQGLRFSFFWLLLAFLVCTHRSEDIRRDPIPAPR